MPRKYAPTHLQFPEKGRVKVEWPAVPHVAQYRVETVGEWLADHRNVRRPLTVATPLLAVVCALYEKNHPLPTRRALSEAFDCNIFSIDAALSTALGEGEVTEEYRYFDGDVLARRSIRRRRYVLPSEQLYHAYSTAERSHSSRNQAQPLKLVG